MKCQCNCNNQAETMFLSLLLYNEFEAFRNKYRRGYI